MAKLCSDFVVLGKVIPGCFVGPVTWASIGPNPKRTLQAPIGFLYSEANWPPEFGQSALAGHLFVALPLPARPNGERYRFDPSLYNARMTPAWNQSDNSRLPGLPL
jgi:hypothetical protein